MIDTSDWCQAAGPLTAPTEAELQRLVTRGLRLLGFLVLSTVVRPKRCRCGAWGGAHTGMDRGVPDLLVRHRTWPTGFWLGMELKSEKGRLRPEQAELQQAGAIVVVRSWEEALAAVQAKPLTPGQGVGDPAAAAAG